MSPPAQFSSVRLGCLGENGQTREWQIKRGCVRGTRNRDDVCAERADPGNAQLCRGRVLCLGNFGQGIDDGKVVPHGLETEGKFQALDIAQRHLHLLETEEDGGGNLPLHDKLVFFVIDIQSHSPGISSGRLICPVKKPLPRGLQ